MTQPDDTVATSHQTSNTATPESANASAATLDKTVATSTSVAPSTSSAATDTSSAVSAVDDDAAGASGAGEQSLEETLTPTHPLLITVETPNGRSVKVESDVSQSLFDVRQCLFESPDTADMTAYHFIHASSPTPLSDWSELHTLPFISEAQQQQQHQQTQTPITITLRMVNDIYDERTVRQHVRRARELIVKPPFVIVPTICPAITMFDQSQADQNTDTSNINGGATHQNNNNNNKKSRNQKKTINNQNNNNKVSSSEIFHMNDDATTLSYSLSSYPSPRTQQINPISPPLLKSIMISAYNPPTGNRVLRGDLLYLQVITLEDHLLYITARTDGFYVNASTSDTFNPNPASPSYKSHSLIELLKKSSSQFQQRYHKCCIRRIYAHLFEHAEQVSSLQPFIWLSLPQVASNDSNKSDDAISSAYGLDSKGLLSRDWNEEYQSTRELSQATLTDRIIRDRTLYRIYADFTECSKLGAIAVVNGLITPVNPQDSKLSHVYLHNQIFFSYAIDSRKLYNNSIQGGDRVSYQMSKLDLHGVNIYSQLDINNLYTILTSIIDYKGHRVIAQSIIPGIFTDKSTKNIYGSLDSGETIQYNENFHHLMCIISKNIHLNIHTIKDKHLHNYILASSVESKGIIGSDSRYYVLDLVRITPRDVNYEDHILYPYYTIRPELVTLYSRKLVVDKMYANRQEKKDEETNIIQQADTPTSSKTDTNVITATERTESNDITDKEATAVAANNQTDKSHDEAENINNNTNSDSNTTADTANTTATTTTTTDSNKSNSRTPYLELLQSISFNPDLFTSANNHYDTDTERINAEQQVRNLSLFLINEQIPKIISGFVSLEYSPVDSIHLVEILHEHGINARYLGIIATSALNKHLYFVQNMAIIEMIARTAKHIIWNIMKDMIDSAKLGIFMATFLSSLVGSHSLGQTFTPDQLSNAAGLVQQYRAAEKAKAKAAAEAATADGTDQGKVAPTAAPIPVAVPAPDASHSVRGKKKGLKHRGYSSAVDATQSLSHTNGTDHSSNFDVTSPLLLWQLIRHDVKVHYNYDLPTTLSLPPRTRLCLLRSFCKRTGIVLLARDYDLNSTTPSFTVDDLVDLLPITYVHLPSSHELTALLENGRSMLGQGQIHSAFQLLNEALTLFVQVYGFLHAQTALCYSLLSIVSYNTGDLQAALDNEQRALLIYERVYGEESHHCATSHLQLSLLLHTMTAHDAAMYHCRRALYLLSVISGDRSADCAAAHMNYAILCQQTAKYMEALQHSKMALDINIAALGESHVQVALSHHTVAIALALLGQFRNALECEKKSKVIFANQLGSKHARTQQSNQWIDHFTSLAVKQSQSSQQLAAQQHGHANDAHKNTMTQQRAAALVSALPVSLSTVVPPQLQNQSPLSWITLQQNVSTRARWTILDTFSLIETNAKHQANVAAASAAAGTQASPSNLKFVEEVPSSSSHKKVETTL